MKKADKQKSCEGVDAEMMSDTTLCRLIEFLKAENWSDTKIVKLLEYIANSNKKR